MSKLAWVLLPLVLAAAVAMVLALRGRVPSRLALNVWSSVLLLVYLGMTAGLGIFWVANQHLPVFDWHYLFGYATVLLLLVHLAFNFRIVWRHWATRAQRRPAAPPAGAAAGLAPARAPRGAALGVLGAVLLALGAFWLGLRHGRTELRVEVAPGAGGAGAGGTTSTTSTASAPGPAGADSSLAVVEQFHEFSAHSRGGLFRRAPGVDWGDPPAPFKRWAGVAAVALPPPRMQAAAHRDPSPPDLPRLATLLFACAGVNLERGSIAFRTSPSSGALFATELYLEARQVSGLEPGLYHYHGGEHRLYRLRGPEPAAGQGAAEIIASAVFRRSGHKYRDRAYRYILADLGHLLENLRAAAVALGLQAEPVRAFDEAAAALRIGLDEAEEGVLARWQLGLPAASPRGAGTVAPMAARAAPDPSAPAATAAAVANAPSAGTGTGTGTGTPAALRAAPLVAGGALGVTEAIHRATSLRAEPAAAAPGAAAPLPRPGSRPPPPGPVVALPEVAAAPMPTLERIARRRSERRFGAAPLSLDELAALLDAAVRRVPPLLSGAVRVDLLSAAVQGLPPAAWRYEPARHALLQRRPVPDLRRSARSAALGQDVIGDAAVTFVLSIDRAAFAADPAGAARGYRHGFLEAGLVGERLYLEGTARGLFVCGVGAFYDDEASALVAVDPAREWVIHFAGVGRPA